MIFLNLFILMFFKANAAEAINNKPRPDMNN